MIPSEVLNTDDDHDDYDDPDDHSDHGDHDDHDDLKNFFFDSKTFLTQKLSKK